MIRIVLGIALRHQKAVVATTATRIFAANRRSSLVDGAAALHGIEEVAGFAEMYVGFAAHGVRLIAVYFGKFLARLLKTQSEMIGQPLHVMLLERDHRVGTAVARNISQSAGMPRSSRLKSPHRAYD